MGRSKNKAVSWLKQTFCFNAQHEAEQYFRQHRAGQELEPLLQHVTDTINHRGRGRLYFMAIAAVAGLSAGYGASQGDVDLGTGAVAVVFGALARRNRQRCQFWQMVGQQANAHGAEFGQRILRSAQRGEADNVRPAI